MPPQSTLFASQGARLSPGKSVSPVNPLALLGGAFGAGFPALPSLQGGDAAPSSAFSDADSGVSGVSFSSPFAVGAGATASDPGGVIAGAVVPVILIGVVAWVLIAIIRR